MSGALADSGFRGAARRRMDGDLDRVAARLGCRVVALEAVLAVETDGHGFDNRGRPAALFEPHVFWRNLPQARRLFAREQGLAWPVWRPGQYPHSQDGIYDQITRACAIDEEAALRAVSWGIGQILGEGHLAAGFDDARGLVQAAMESEGAQLDMMARWLICNRLDRALRDEDWPAFARGYNGAGYAANHYDQKLAAYVSTHQALSALAGVPAAAAPAADPPAADPPAADPSVAGAAPQQGAGG